MTPKEFIAEYKGKTVGYPGGSYIGQCLSLTKWYIKDCFNIAPPASGSNSAFGYWSNFPSPLGTKFKKVEYTTGMTIPEWCIPIWNTNVGNGYGHIAVRTDKKSTTSNFESLDQNWNTKVATLVNHTYKDLRGWLAPLDLVEEPSDIIEDMEQLPKDNVLRDILNALCGSTSDDEVKAYLDGGKNIYEVVIDVCQGNERFYNKWIALQNQPGSVETPETVVIPSDGYQNGTATTTPQETPNTPSSLSRLWTRIKRAYLDLISNYG
jgi:hypothetical protein